MAKKQNRLTLKKETAVRIFEGLGFKTVGKWATDRLRKKVANLPELVEGVKSKDKFMRKALAAIQAADKVVLAKTEGEQQSEKKEQREEKVLQKAAKTAKKKKVSSKKKEKKPGVIASVLEFIKNSGPISAKQILAGLKKRFPDRNPESMERSIPRVPGYLAREEGIKNIKKNNKGQYYIKK